MKLVILSDTSQDSRRAIEILNASEHEILGYFVKSKSDVSEDMFIEKSEHIEIKEYSKSLDILKSYLKSADLLISYCFPSLIEKKLFKLPKYGGINFHPAPLPDYRGFAVYNFAIVNEEKQWGATVHCLEDKYDAGPILKIKNFIIDPDETAESLRSKSHKHMLQLLDDILNNFMKLYAERYKQNKIGTFYSKNKMNAFKKIKDSDTIEIIKNKIRAFWCPPHSGATLTIHGEEFTIVSSELLEKLWREENG